ncbi:MAG: hypothetical protein HY902_05600, partial [Deltaproteobacteria bacterium]|nr:hypothetical protein [Deltaproteobacteria bacterium]
MSDKDPGLPTPTPSEPSSLSRLRDFDKVRERMVLRIEVRHVVQVAVLVVGLAAAAFVGGWVAGRNGWQPTWLSGLTAASTAEPSSLPPVLPDPALAVAPTAPIAPAATPTVAEAAAPGE